jgi:hypothetical protein
MIPKLSLKLSLKWLAFVCLAGLLAPALSRADDTAVAIATGGLVPRQETRIVMAKEVLAISTSKIVVDYDFRNDTDEDVTTEVAFPVPPYGHGPLSLPVKMAAFSDFLLQVDGKAVAFAVQAKAFSKQKEVTQILETDHIDIASFGHLDEGQGGVYRVTIPDLMRLPAEERNRLIALGIFDLDKDGAEANYDVQLQYHWTQRFPAHSTTHIRHEYTPLTGYEIIPLGDIRLELAYAEGNTGTSATQNQKLGLDRLESFCADKSFLRGVLRRSATLPKQNWGYASPQWVDFILTTANAWKKPIEDFTLIVDRTPAKDGSGGGPISFCSPNSTDPEKLDANHFRVHLTNFVPTRELRIAFF